MALLGSAALAMWWDVCADVRTEFEDWHSHEHFPERLGIPGFRRGSRWRGAKESGDTFVMYELASYDVLSSSHYVARLNAPTPWSTKMMPHHHNMVRCQCRVMASRGGNVAAHALTVRMTPAVQSGSELSDAVRSRIDALVARPGLTGAHLMRHERPPIATTTEQRIRGRDGEADWIFVINGYDAQVLRQLAAEDVAPEQLAQLGAAPGAVVGLYTLSYAAIPGDVQ